MNTESLFSRAYRVPHTVDGQTHAARKISRAEGEVLAWCGCEFKLVGDGEDSREINCPGCLKALGEDG